MTFTIGAIGTLKQLSKDLKAGKQFRIGKNGEWQFSDKSPYLADRIFHGLSDKIFRHDTVNLSKLPEAFCKRFLDPIESTPVLFRPKAKTSLSELFRPKASLSESDAEKIELQNDYFAALLEAKEAIDTALARANIHNEITPRMQLSARIVSMQYRFESENGGYDVLPKNLASMDTELEKLAKSWKAVEKNYPEGDRGLSERDNAHLLEMSRYPRFVDILKKYDSLRNTFFKWAIRDNGQAKGFVQFLKHWELLDNSYLTPRISFYGSELLAITKKISKKFSGRKKILTIPIEVLTSENKLEVKPKNILDPNKEVTLNKGWTLSIKKIIEIFANKNLDFGNLEYFGKGGIKNWNPQKLGFFNPATNSHDLIDLDLPNWWEQLPSLDPVTPITLDEMKRRYNGLGDLKTNEWVVIVRGARKSPTLSIDNSHGFIEVAIPQKNGTFKLYDFGKLAAVFPNGTMELLSFLANTVESKIYYPDENIFYHYRQHAAWVRRLVDKVDSDMLMNLIKDFLKQARSGNLVFQFGWENCAFLPQMILETMFGKGNVPNFFKVSVVELRAPAPLNALFAFMRWFPTFLHAWIIKGIELMFFAWRGMEVTEKGQKVFKSIWRSPLDRERCNFLPAKLAHDILNKTPDLKSHGTVWYGVK